MVYHHQKQVNFDLNITIQKEFESRSIKILSSGFDRIPKTSKQLTADQQEEVLELIEKIEEDVDVQNVYHDMEIQE